MTTFERYCVVEWTLDRVRSHLGALANKGVKDDLVTACYVLSIVRSYAQTFEQTLSPEDKAEALQGLFEALYR